MQGLLARHRREGGGWCGYCDSAEVEKVRMPYAFKLMLQELMAMNIAPRMRLKGAPPLRPDRERHRLADSASSVEPGMLCRPCS